MEATIDELAHEAGMPVSTVRMYQNKGLLPPPERRGRVGYYSQNHSDRLRIIAHLQERSFSLAAIKETLDAWATGRSLDHLLNLAELTPGIRREPLRLTLNDLAERFQGIALTQTDIQQAVEIGLITIDGDEVVVANAAFADIGPAVARLGVPVSEILAQYAKLRQAMTDTAERFRQIFDEYVWQPFEADGLPADRVPALLDDANQLTALATSVVTIELQDRFAQFAAKYVDQATSEKSGTDRQAIASESP